METALYLIPVTLGDTEISQVLPEYNASIVRELRHFVVEEVRTARRFLRKMDKEFPIDNSTFYEMGKHAGGFSPLPSSHKGNVTSDRGNTTLDNQFEEVIKVLENGTSVGVISEAGCPAVADPGAIVVGMAQMKGLRVIPLVGPSSMIMSVMASGLNGQNFAFNGYLPVDPADRAKRLKALESRAINENQTQLFIETPFRNRKMFEALCQNLRPQTHLCIAAGITTTDEWIHTYTIQKWKRLQLPDLSKIPAIFLIGK